MSQDIVVLDCEVAPNAFGLGVKRLSDSKKVWYEFSEWADFDRAKVRRMMRNYMTVGFNSQAYDLAMIYLALDGATNEEIMDASNRVIQERMQYWEVERTFGIVIPKINHIDLFETNPSVKNGLKALAARLHIRLLQELPFKPNTKLSPAEWEEGKQYCLNGDLEGTHALFNLMKEPIMLREALRERYNTVDLRSKSDAQVGETIIKTEVERRLGTKVKRAVIAEGSTFRYEPPEWMKFDTPLMRNVFETIKNTDFEIGKGGKVAFPRVFSNFKIEFDGLRHTLGIGGLHSTEANRCVLADDDHVLIDGDVASQYPRIIMTLGLYPKALGAEFSPVYNSIIEERLKAKRAKDKVADKGLKIAINGSYGKLGSAYSVLFAPNLMIAVTLTGQLSLLMLIERAHLMGIPVVSANTDGVVFKVPRSMYNGFVLREDGTPTDRLAPSPIQDIIEWWEGATGFSMEFNEYSALYNQSVNTYIATKPDGSYKRKGALANHWRPDLPWGGKNTDYDPARSGLMKNPAMTICSDAVLGFLLKGIPIEQTIMECTDIREFITVVNATGGATWGEGENEGYLGKVVRYYWSTQGAPIIKVKPHPTTGNRPKVPKTDGCRPIMTLPDDFAVPPDLDYARYIAEAKSILKDIGYGLKESRGLSRLEHLYSLAGLFNNMVN